MKDWIAEHPPPDGAYTQTVAGVAERVRSGEDFRFAVRELLDEFALRTTAEQRSGALEAEPPRAGDARKDAFLAALAEHLAMQHGLPTPSWALAEDRFLDRMWFVSPTPAFRPTAIRESPAAFRRRGIFVARGTLQRV